MRKVVSRVRVGRDAMVCIEHHVFRDTSVEIMVPLPHVVSNPFGQRKSHVHARHDCTRYYIANLSILVLFWLKSVCSPVECLLGLRIGR